MQKEREDKLVIVPEILVDHVYRNGDERAKDVSLVRDAEDCV